MRTLTLALLFISLSAAAQEPPAMQSGIGIAPPTQYVDGSTIAAGELARMTLLCGEATGSYDQELILAPDATFIAKADILGNMTIRYKRVYFCASTATATNGETSGYSIEINFTVPDDRSPEPPRISVQ